MLVIAFTAFCARMGIWQLDRLVQRRAFNAHVEEMWAAEPLNLNADIPENLIEMEYRAVFVSGTYDFENQVALRNQHYLDSYGYHLLTPLILDDGSAVIVDRGWIPAEGNDSPSGWNLYNEQEQADVRGVIRLGQVKAQIGGIADPTLEPGQSRLDFWYVVNLERFSQQVPYSLLPIYVQPDMIEGNTEPPIPFQPELELTEGPHFGYALQWFTFATILFVGYPFYLRKQVSDKQ